MRTATGGAARIVVVGGGAGGLELAIRLARLTRMGDRARVTLVDRRAAHVWKPRLHEIAAGMMTSAEEAADYAAQARRHGFTFVLGEVARLDVAARSLALAATPQPADDPVAAAQHADLLPARTLAYDVAVLALGSTVNDFGTPGVAEHAYALDAPDDADRLHRALLAQAARVEAGVQPALRVVIVGAGTTGVELAGELRDAARRLPRLRSLIRPEQLEVTLLEMGDRPLPGSPHGASAYARRMLQAQHVAMRFGAKVVRVEADAVKLASGNAVGADVIVWASGVKAQRLSTPVEGVRRAKDGRIATDDRLRVLAEDGRVTPGLYGLGDCAAAPLPGGGVAPATAQAAHQQALLLARSLARQERGREPLAFRYRDRGALVSLGRGAVGDVPGAGRGGELQVSGLGARLAYAGLYEAHQAELFGAWRTSLLALSRALRQSARPRVKMYW